jgi:signal transduction histidine kinase
VNVVTNLTERAPRPRLPGSTGEEHMTESAPLASRRSRGGAPDGSDDPARRIVSAVAAAIAPESSCVRLLLVDEAGAPSIAASLGEDRRFGRLDSARRRQVLETGVPIRLPRSAPGLTALAIQPLLDEGRVTGVVEIVAPVEALDRLESSWKLVNDLSVALLAGEARLAELEQKVLTMAALGRLSEQLMGSDSPTAALRTATDLCAQHIGRPAATARPDRAAPGWYLVAASRLGSRRRSQLRAALRKVPVSPAMRARTSLQDSFAEIANTRAAVVEIGVAVMIVADPTPEQLEFIEVVAGIVAQALDRIATLQWARIRNENADLGIAWTAHELKGPLVGAKAALDHVLASSNELDKRGVLVRMRGEIEQLTDLVDPLLRWSAGIGTLEVRPFDLVTVVARAIDSSVLEERDDRVVLTVPETLAVRGDAGQIRSAVSNLVRNALAYSPPGTPVRVVVKAGDAVASIAVSDRGPGVDPAERHLIFDPFARGRAGGLTRGQGLGLFIARRVVEAHGGRVTVRSRGSGATFTMELPLGAETRQRSAS